MTTRLWTLQPLTVWEAVQSHGTLPVDPEHPDFDRDFSYREPYDWMREQMRQRLPDYHGGYPWWAYGYKLDLRTQRFQVAAGEGWVRMELEIAPERVLLSAYGDWHYVLNDWYLPAKDVREVDGRFEEVERETPPQNPDATQRMQSWGRIFEVEKLRPTQTIQACFECLALADVVRVTPFLSAYRDRNPAR